MEISLGDTGAIKTINAFCPTLLLILVTTMLFVEPVGMMRMLKMEFGGVMSLVVKSTTAATHVFLRCQIELWTTYLTYVIMAMNLYLCITILLPMVLAVG